MSDERPKAHIVQKWEAPPTRSRHCPSCGHLSPGHYEATCHQTDKERALKLTLPLAAASPAAVPLPDQEEEKQVAAVRVALDIEGNVHDRGDFDRGIQAVCARVRAALDDPNSFLNPQPAQGAPSLPGEQPGGQE